MIFEINPKSVVWENRVYDVTGYQLHKGKRYAEAIYKHHGILVNINPDDLELRENLIKRLEHRI